ncbi:hypothetical protein [Streptomyces sp. NBC_01314]|uniref:hypothetical protein n=1 Tax=Streptomyces sp. NBC_01314 TaxID=2903821 RepID=UPI00308A787A|nr:hypothetical protein OG622_03300 [Streptomyces sp. NBC_01314]
MLRFEPDITFRAVPPMTTWAQPGCLVGFDICRRLGFADNLSEDLAEGGLNLFQKPWAAPPGPLPRAVRLLVGERRLGEAESGDHGIKPA